MVEPQRGGGVKPPEPPSKGKLIGSTTKINTYFVVPKISIIIHIMYIV